MRAPLLVLVAIALAWLGVGDASAHPRPCGRVEDNCSIGDAQAEASSQSNAQAHCDEQWTPAGVTIGVVANLTHRPAPQYNPAGFDARIQCVHAASGTVLSNQLEPYYYTTGCPVGQEWNSDTKSCVLPCEVNAPIPSGSAHAPGESDSFCADGCTYSCNDFSIVVTVDGELRTVCAGAWSTVGGATCSIGDAGPLNPVTDSDGDGISDGNDASPNNPGSGGGGPEDASDTGNPDAPGSGNGNTSGGGGDCNTPPRSTGDAILAQIAFQTWATRCAIVGNANAGTGTGEGAGDGPGTGGEFDGDAEGESAAMHGSDGDPVRADVVDAAPGLEEGELDTSGYGYSRACVTSPTVTVFGQTITLDTGPMCQWLELGSWFVLVLAGLASARIINGGMA